MRGVHKYKFADMELHARVVIPCNCDANRLQQSISGIICRVQKKTGRLFSTRQVEGELVVTRRK